MPKVHFVRKALPARSERTAQMREAAGIQPGDSYYWWEFKYGGMRMSKERPRPSQLTQSHWSQVYAAQENIQDATTWEDLKSAISDAISEVDEVRGAYQEASDALENTNGQNQNQERADHLESLMSELESIHDDMPDEPELDEPEGGWGDGEEDEAIEEAMADFRDRVDQLEWDSPV